ncbi:monocarboxylate transporter 11-like [Mytilus trossulus]|uniref:monocarboxylate transporter 11-like n=1 Tax=Mytilus trossulus TaxID=6551 RepID=UPI0030068C5E
MRSKANTDGGYAWVVLSACVILQFLTAGVVSSFGLFFVEILEVYDEKVSTATLIMGLMNGVYCLSSLPIMMYLIKILKPRTTVILGSFITASGYSLSCLAGNIYFLFFTLSFLVGVGMALILPPSIYLLGTYFSKRRAMANGIAISGCCLGGLVCPPLYRYLLDNYGLRGALLLTGGILMHNIPMACLLRPNGKSSNISKKSTEKEADNEGKTTESDEPVRSQNAVKDHSIKNGDVNIYNVSSGSDPLLYEKKSKAKLLSSSENCLYRNVDTQLLDGHYNMRRFSISDSFTFGNRSASLGLSMTNLNSSNNQVSDSPIEVHKCPHPCTPFLNPTFFLFVITNCLATTVAATFLSYLPLYAKHHNIDNTKIVVLVSLTGAVDFIGRICSGILADMPQIKTYYILAISQGVCGVVYNCNSLLTSFAGLLVFCVAIGLFAGVQLVLMFSHTVEIVGLDLTPPAVSILIVGQLPAFIFGPLIFGLLRDSTGDFVASFHTIGALALLSSALFLCEPLTNRIIRQSQGVRFDRKAVLDK